MTAATNNRMDFSIPAHPTTGILNGDDLLFFYYDIGIENLQDWSKVYDWDSVVAKFDGLLDIDACSIDQIPEHYTQNKIRFTVFNDETSGDEPKAAAFFRHLRNAFAHYHIIREGDNYILTDMAHKTTMRGLVNADLLKRFCYSFFEIRESIITDTANSNQPPLNNKI